MTRLVALLSALALCVGCSTIRTVEIRTEPPDAKVFVDDEPIGISPVRHPFEFDDPDALYKVSVEKEGYVRGRKRVSQLHLDAALENREGDGPEFIVIKIDEDESWTRTRPSKLANTWIEIEVNPQLDEAQVWEMLVDSLTKYYPELTNLDNEAGYIAAKEKTKRFQRGPVATVLVKNQFFCSMSSRSPLVYKLKIDCQLNDEGKWTAFDRVFEEDEKLLSDLEARLVLQR